MNKNKTCRIHPSTKFDHLQGIRTPGEPPEQDIFIYFQVRLWGQMGAQCRNHTNYQDLHPAEKLEMLGDDNLSSRI